MHRFALWVRRKEQHERAIALAQRCDVARRCGGAGDDAPWLELAVALAAVDVAQLRAAEADDAAFRGACARWRDGGGAGDATVRKMFQRYDADGSGQLESGELRSLFRDLGAPTEGAFFERARRDLDTSRDGVISLEEPVDVSQSTFTH